MKTKIGYNLFILLAVGLDTGRIGLVIGVRRNQEEGLHRLENGLGLHRFSDFAVEVLDDRVIGSGRRNNAVVDAEYHVVTVAEFLHRGNVGHALKTLVRKDAENDEVAGLVVGGQLGDAYADRGDVVAEQSSNSGVGAFVGNMGDFNADLAAEIAHRDVLDVAGADVADLHLTGVGLAVGDEIFHRLDVGILVNGHADRNIGQLRNGLEVLIGITGIRGVGAMVSGPMEPISRV